MIREALVKDSARIAEIEVMSSRFAYKGIVPDDYLFKDLTVENRVSVYEYWIGEKRFELYVYEDPDSGFIKGMMGIGRCEDEDKLNAFELHFIYVDPDYLREGIGSEMLQFFEQKGRERGFEEFVTNSRPRAFMRSITILWTGKIRSSSAGISVRSDM